MTGKNISTSDSMGEMDIVGLSAGFLSGGARGVLAPLWSINDSIAARFSIEFYTALFADITVGFITCEKNYKHRGCYMSKLDSILILLKSNNIYPK
jgi:hypothetical protein